MIPKKSIDSLKSLYQFSRFAVCKDKKYLDKDWQKGKSYQYYCDKIRLNTLICIKFDTEIREVSA